MHPYSALPDQNFWRRFVPRLPWRDLPLAQAKFRIGRSDAISTAGSCFAQHISRYLREAGIPTFRAETAHSLMHELGGEVASYDRFPARYGNIYTARQCLELFRQAFGVIPVIQDYAEEKGRYYDLMRPNAIPDGFGSLAEAQADRLYHLACVRHMFLHSNVFILTLGLTECWYHAEQGHTYPVCPGTARGKYDAQLHQFRNMTHAEVTADLEQLITSLKAVNPALKLILTVSPVPLVATYTNQNVLVASSYSKSVLRAAAGEIEMRHDHVAYFPSYEIISHAGSYGQYMESDLREVTERGVQHVMTHFLATYLAPAQPVAATAAATATATAPQAFLQAPVFDTKAECEEIFNDLGHAQAKA
ncbi:MAG: GSCFA domain-containing protein [Duganella sp.]